MDCHEQHAGRIDEEVRAPLAPRRVEHQRQDDDQEEQRRPKRSVRGRRKATAPVPPLIQ
jgi:hypothetical protein